MPRALRVGLACAGLVTLLSVASGAQMLWTQHSPASSLSYRRYCPIAYDAARRRVVMLSLLGGKSLPPGLQGTLEWDGIRWIQRNPKTQPTGEYPDEFAMAYDAARGRIVALGGSYNNFTWTWDGTNWSLAYPDPSPSRRVGCAMAFDAARRLVVAFGGGITYGISNETWEWDGATWRRVVPVFSPAGRKDHAMAFDAARGQLVLFGGCGPSPFVYLGDTWVWMKNTWIRKVTAIAPSARCGHTMAYDARRKRVVLFGGHDGKRVFGDTWEWDGVRWAQASVPAAPRPRFRASMAYHAGAQRMLLFGGQGAIQYQLPFYDDTWEYGETHLSASGLPRPGHVMSFVLLAAGDVGRRYQIGSSLSSGPTQVDTVTLGLKPDALFALSLSGELPGVFRRFSGTIDGNGQATAAIGIPQLAALVGTTIHTAFVTVDFVSPLGTRSVSNTESFRIQR